MALSYDSRGNPILSEGVDDPSVAWLNQVLGWWGYTPGQSSMYDATTVAAVKTFQTRYGYKPTGVMDDSTWGLMDALARGEPAPAQLQSVNGVPITGALTGRGDKAPVAPTTPATGPNAETTRRDAAARINGLLRQYGLTGMEGWLNEKLMAGSSAAEIELELFDQPAFQARFPVIGARMAAGLTPVGVSEVLEYEQRGRELMRGAGITSPEFTSTAYLQGIMARDVSMAEVQTRLQNGLLKVTNAPPEVRVAFGNYFGTNGDAALAQFFLDPDKAVPELEKMAMTAVAGGVGSRFGVQIAQGIAREIADTGVSDAAIWQGFGKLDSIKSIFEESISETQDLTAEGEGIGAIFGTQAGATDTLQRRVDTRTSQFRGGGGAASGDQGVVGLGVADS